MRRRNSLPSRSILECNNHVSPSAVTTLGIVHKWGHGLRGWGQEICDIGTEALVMKSVTKGGGRGVTNYPKLCFSFGCNNSITFRNLEHGFSTWGTATSLICAANFWMWHFRYCDNLTVFSRGFLMNNLGKLLWNMPWNLSLKNLCHIIKPI